MKTIKKAFFALSCLLFICILLYNQLSKVDIDINKKHIIAIFIHGTILPIPSISSFINAIKNKSHKNFFQKYYDDLKTNGEYKSQPIGKIGLEKIKLKENTDNKINNLISQIHKQQFLKLNNNNNNIKYSFYSFSWNGRLSKKERINAAENLYKELTQEIAKRDMQNIEVYILAHSHGGNVALNLALAEDEFKKNLLINKLILFGTPVQSETRNLIHSSIFEKIYHTYSKGDNIQILDNFSTRDFFSQRQFKNKTKKNFRLPDKLTQIEVIVGNKKPTHCELWFFGETNLPRYRKNFPIYPLPLAAISPIIIDFIETSIPALQNSSKDLKLKIEKRNENIYLSAENQISETIPEKKFTFDSSNLLY